MLSLSFSICDLPPMPRNRSHMLTVAGKRPMNIKTQLCREFEKDLESRLLRLAEDFKRFKESFDPKLHYIEALYTIHTPAPELFTKDGRISSRATDTDCHKVMRDVLYKCIGLDDKVERDSRFFTPVSEDDKWNYTITLIVREKEALYV